MPSNKDLDRFIENFDDLMNNASGSDLDCLSEQFGAFEDIPDELFRANTILSMMVSVGVSLARLGYVNQDILRDLELLRLMYETSPEEARNKSFELLRQRYQETVIDKDKRERLKKKLDEMNQVIDKCNSTPGRRRCLCIELECLVPYCGRRVAGHGYLVCEHHHDAYCDSGFRGGLLDWSFTKL